MKLTGDGNGRILGSRVGHILVNESGRFLDIQVLILSDSGAGKALIINTNRAVGFIRSIDDCCCSIVVVPFMIQMLVMIPMLVMIRRSVITSVGRSGESRGGCNEADNSHLDGRRGKKRTEF